MNYELAVGYAQGGDPDGMVRSLKDMLKQEADRRCKKAVIVDNTAELRSLIEEFGIQDPVGSNTILGKVLGIYQEVGLDKTIAWADSEIEERRSTGQIDDLFHYAYPKQNIILSSRITPEALTDMINGHISLIRKGRLPDVEGLRSDLNGLLKSPRFPFPDHINTLLKEIPWDAYKEKAEEAFVPYSRFILLSNLFFQLVLRYETGYPGVRFSSDTERRKLADKRTIRFAMDHYLGLVKGLDTTTTVWLGGKDTVSARFAIVDQLPEIPVLKKLIDEDVKALYLLPDIPNKEEVEAVMDERI